MRSFRSLRHASRDPALLDLAAGKRKHNAKAAILRNGLAVVAFASLEHFLRERASELLECVANDGTRFDHLTDHQRHEMTVGTLDAVRYQLGLAGKRGEDVADFAVDELRCFAAYRDPVPTYSRWHFGQSKANLGPEDVKRLLRLFGVTNGWHQIESLAARIGSALPGSEDIFRSAALRRHGAAHDPSASCTSADLQSFVEHGLILGCCFDILATHAAMAVSGRTIPAGGVDKFEAGDAHLRFVDRLDDRWAEKREGGVKSVKIGDRFKPLLLAAAGRAKARNETVVGRMTGLRVREWVTPE